MSISKAKQTKRKHFNKTPWLIAIAIVALLVAGYFGKVYCDTYHNRPLADGLQYVGRDYSSGCAIEIIKFMCTSPKTEYLYYATDVEPKDVVKLFPGWKVEKVLHVRQGLNDNKSSSEVDAYNLINRQSGDAGYFGYIKDKKAVTSASQLLSSDKKFIISINARDYDKFLSSSKQ